MVPPDVRAAEIIAATYEHLRREFLRLTLLARRRFEERDFVVAHRDSQDRLELYEPCAGRSLACESRARFPPPRFKCLGACEECVPRYCSSLA